MERSKQNKRVVGDKDNGVEDSDDSTNKQFTHPHKWLIVIRLREVSKTCVLLVIKTMVLMIVLTIVMTEPTSNSHI
eukprot:3733325-Ditylum_brightwellii.AAC.1